MTDDDRDRMTEAYKRRIEQKSRVLQDDRDLIEPYVVWSHEHGAWWGPGGNGYVTRIGQAGRYSRTEAMRICSRAIPGNLGALPEIPVRLADLEQMVEAYVAKFGDQPERDKWR